MSKRRAFVRYSKNGKIVPGSLITTNGSYPNGPSLWREVLVDLCCETPTPIGPDACATLGRAAGFSLLTNTAITYSGTFAVVEGDLGLSPGTSVVGVPPAIVQGTQYVADGLGPNATADAALVDALAAYNCLFSKTPTGTIAAIVADETITPGVYFLATTLGVNGTVILDGQGDPDALFIFQIGSALTTGATSSVVLTNGAQAGNVYWVAGTAATTGVGSSMVGNIIADAGVTIGGNLVGRAFALGAAITFDGNITTPPCTVNPCI